MKKQEGIKKLLKSHKVLSAAAMTAVSAALICGIHVVSSPSEEAGAAMLANERSLAGINLSLDKYYAKNADLPEQETVTETAGETENTEEGVPASEDSTPKQPDSEPEPAVSMTAVNETEEDEETAEEMEKEAEEETEKPKDINELISNLNVGRLGIATVDNYLNIRKKPGEDGKIIGKLPKNAGCHVYKIKDGWAKIVSNKVTGWVSADYLTTDEEAEELALEVGKRTATTTESTVNIRFLPSTDSSIYTLVPVDEDMIIANEHLTEKYVRKVMSEFKKDEKFLIENVDVEDMMKDLDQWICVKLNGERVFVSRDCVETSYQLKKAVAIDVDSYSSEKTGISSTRSDMVNYAMQFLGNPYVWGGTSLTNGCDCSGFTLGIYSRFGYGLPRTSAAQASVMTGISYNEAQPGDLFFYGNGYSVSHVAMYIGNGQIIHAMDENHGICISNAYYMTPMKIGRMIN